jgi:hypothetical protein
MGRRGRKDSGRISTCMAKQDWAGWDLEKRGYCRIKRECVATAFTTTDPGINNAGVRRFTITECINFRGSNNAGRGRVAALSMRGKQERQHTRKVRKKRQAGQRRQASEANETDRGCRQERQKKTGTVWRERAETSVSRFFLETPCKHQNPPPPAIDHHGRMALIRPWARFTTARRVSKHRRFE